ncbi:MAG: hypothetical protein EOP11_04155 [Proteobacteria bacterium]|nr:MAG: hypothetical protein EOP11_04155 [Pseudomonadota bacterium]
MKAFVALAALSFAFATAAATAADGRYQGSGTLEVQGRDSVRCDRVSLDISEDAYSIYIRQFEFDCDDQTHASMEPRRFEVRGQDVYSNGERVGFRTPGNTQIEIREYGTGTVLGLNFREDYYNTVDVMQELSAPNFAQRMKASLRRY